VKRFIGGACVLRQCAATDRDMGRDHRNKESNTMTQKLIRRLTLAAALALSVGFAVPGWADDATAAGKTPEAGLNYAAKSCNLDERAAIVGAFALAKERLALAVNLARARPDHPKLAEWFGNAPRDKILAVLEAVKMRIDSAAAIQIECSQDRCAQLGNPMAYANPRTSIVGFCARFFRSQLTGEDSRFGTVVHEVSHLVGTTDHAYSRANARALAVKAPALAAANADNYEYFLETLAD
jgi:peptidyl-Lys metalloendopeptidase